MYVCTRGRLSVSFGLSFLVFCKSQELCGHSVLSYRQYLKATQRALASQLLTSSSSPLETEHVSSTTTKSFFSNFFIHRPSATHKSLKVRLMSHVVLLQKADVSVLQLCSPQAGHGSPRLQPPDLCSRSHTHSLVALQVHATCLLRDILLRKRLQPSLPKSKVRGCAVYPPALPVELCLLVCTKWDKMAGNQM